ncbi:hypothetical protein ACIGXA_39120 [Streptomyces fildesensis]|uniref:Uncharacterized protein n=1 Tax=Streptomyces fildesensis TaxID=375757 RepID=A0ABW8CJD3_9ACTN
MYGVLHAAANINVPPRTLTSTTTDSLLDPDRHFRGSAPTVDALPQQIAITRGESGRRWDALPLTAQAAALGVRQGS